MNDGTPLFHAITYNQIEITKLLVKEGADVNLVKNNRTVLSMAAERGKIEYVELLIEAGADVNQRAVPPLGCVVRTFSQFPSVNKGRCIDVLIKAGADVNTPLVNCAGACSSRVLAILLNAGADVKLFPFHEVVGLDHKLDCVKLLIQKGADVNKQNNCGETPVYKAASLCDKTYLKLLVNSGADVNIPNNHGVTPLMEVAEKGSRIIEELVTAIQNPTHCTHPANIRYIELIRILLKFGARINCKDELGRNALEFASLDSGTEDHLKEFHMFLYAAGETFNIDQTIPKYLTELKENLNLKHLCREAIRKHLIDLDPHEHLFGRIPRLGLPSLLTEYLLYDCSLDSTN